MSSVDTRPPFFPNSTPKRPALSRAQQSALQRNSFDRVQELEDKTGKDAKVQIPNTIRDFSRIKKAVDASTEVDNSDKIANLKAQIAAGTYEVDYDALADKILSSEY
jgi:negative regulator of flagellin synthesis FlgM